MLLAEVDPGLVAAIFAGVGSIITVFFTWVINYRKHHMQNAKVERREDRIHTNFILRKHEEMIDNLEAEIKILKMEIGCLKEEHAKCQKDNMDLRIRISQLDGKDLSSPDMII